MRWIEKLKKEKKKESIDAIDPSIYMISIKKVDVKNIKFK